MKKNIIEIIKNHLEIPVFVFVLLITKMFPSYSIDIILIFIFGAIGFGAFFISKKTRYKLILRLFSLYVLLNFLVFPLAYLTLIKYSSDSFEFDKSIISNEKFSSFSDLTSQYHIDKLNIEHEVIQLVFADSPEKLDSTLSFLNAGNAIILNNYILTKNCIPVPAHRPMYRAILNVCDLTGNRIGYIENKDEGCALTNGNQTIKTFLEARLVILNEKRVEFRTKASAIVDKNDIWKYRQILPYTLNIFTTDNMIPKSRMANFIFFLHQIIVATAIISIIIGIIQNYLANHNDDNANSTTA